MTLDKKKTIKSSIKLVKVSLFETLEDGIYYKRGTKDAKRWAWPIFIGRVVVPGLGSEPVRTEFVREGKQYKFVFYDTKLGMIAKINAPNFHVQYILRELIHRGASVPIHGRTSMDRVGTILNINQSGLNEMVADAERTQQASKEVYK